MAQHSTAALALIGRLDPSSSLTAIALLVLTVANASAAEPPRSGAAANALPGI
jgi:hypothetical protein